MRRAYKKADGKRIDGRNIVVDVERGRTVLDWRPRRLGKQSLFRCYCFVLPCCENAFIAIFANLQVVVLGRRAKVKKVNRKFMWVAKKLEQ